MYCCSAFNSHSRVFNNEQSAYTLKWVWKDLWPAVKMYFLYLHRWMLHLDIFIVLVLLGVYNFISQMWYYQQENKTPVKQSYKYRHYCDRHHVTRLLIQIKRQPMGSHQVNSKTTRRVLIAPVQSRNHHCLIKIRVFLAWYISTIYIVCWFKTVWTNITTSRELSKAQNYNNYRSVFEYWIYNNYRSEL